MAKKRPDESTEPEEIGKPHPTGERVRDEQREEGGPRYGGGKWEVADERGERRFGTARNDDADPSELAKGEGATDDDDTWPGGDPRHAGPQSASAVADVADDGGTEHGGQRAGMGRGEEPQKPKARVKHVPHSRR